MIVLIRHASTLSNETGRMAVGVPGPSLSTAGRRDALQAARAWRQAEPPGVIWTSPAARAVETANILFPGREAVQDPGLTEIDPGEWGSPLCQAGTSHHSELMRSWEAGGNLKSAPPEGESGSSVLERLAPVVAALKDGDEAGVVAVTHFGVIRMILAGFVFGFDRLSLPSAEFPRPLQSVILRTDRLVWSLADFRSN